MKELIQGIISYRKETRPKFRESFAHLVKEQSPHALMISCSDSRVVPTLFTNTGPGDLFTVRNVGNLVPPCDEGGMSAGDESVWAAIEYSLIHLPVWDIIVCGHSECSAMLASLGGIDLEGHPHLRAWLRHSRPSLERLEHAGPFNPELERHNALSQINILQQLEHLKTYPLLRKRLEENALHLHGWWFDIGQDDLYAYEEASERFVLMDDAKAASILAALNR